LTKRAAVAGSTVDGREDLAGFEFRRCRLQVRVAADGPAGTPSGTWTFSYHQGTNLNETWVVGPSGQSRYRYDGIGTAGPFNVWRTGTLTRRSRYSLSDVELERETLSYIRSDVLVNVPVGNPNDPWYDDAVYRPLVSQRTIARDPGQSSEDSSTTSFEYHSGDATYNDYGQPWRISQWPYYTAREIQRTFVPPGFFTPYVPVQVDRPERGPAFPRQISPLAVPLPAGLDAVRLEDGDP
jgi:hypothetical protein